MKALLWNNRNARSILIMLMALVMLALAPPGCSGEECVGGVLRGDGTCEPKCDASKCLAGNICVDNQCKLQCSKHGDCIPNLQECQAATSDDGAAVLACQPNGRQPVLTDGFPVGGFAASCSFNDDQCSATACPNGLECDANACADCQLDAAACGDIEHCNIGRCAATGAACTFNTCPLNECKKMVCVTSGEGDATAYCTANDCAENRDCPGGFYCATTRDARAVCGRTCDNGSCSHDGSACTGDARCTKGVNACGDPGGPCIEEAQLSADGASLFDGSLCLQRRTCLLADECAPCETNLDCSRGVADVCADNAGENVCARFCAADANCAADKSCKPYGSTCENAPTKDCQDSADCPDNGACVERSVCLPRSGACQPAPSPDNFCKHCVNDTDCGGPGSSMFCLAVNDSENACFDLSFSVECTVDTDCPTAPSGANGECLDEAEGVAPGSGAYQRCYVPFSTVSSRFTCWP